MKKEGRPRANSSSAFCEYSAFATDDASGAAKPRVSPSMLSSPTCPLCQQRSPSRCRLSVLAGVAHRNITSQSTQGREKGVPPPSLLFFFLFFFRLFMAARGALCAAEPSELAPLFFFPSHSTRWEAKGASMAETYERWDNSFSSGAFKVRHGNADLRIWAADIPISRAKTF